MEDRFHKNVTTENGNSGTFTMGPKFKTVPIAANIPNIMRLVNPKNFVKYHEAWIKCDDGTKRPFILGCEDENGQVTWNVLMEIVGDIGRWCKGGILESIKDPVTGKQKFIWESKAPDVFLKVKYNGDPSGNEGSWKPRPLYAFQAISRSGETNPETGIYEYYSQINNKTQVLKAGQMLYNSLVTISDNSGELDTYDINVYRTGSTQTDTKYTVYKAEKEKYPNTVIGGLSEAEKAYATWNLSSECAVSSAEDILNYLEKAITDVDRAMGTNFIKKLKDLAGPNYVKTAAVSNDFSDDAIPSAAPAAPVQAPIRSVAPAVAKPAEVAAAPVGFSCHNCKTAVADDAEYCPKCQTQVGGACTDCGKVFSVYASKCPHCNKDYSTVG